MSGTNSSRNKAVLAGAVGAGVLLAGAGLFLFHHLDQKKKMESLERKLARLDLSLSKLYQEFMALRGTRGSVSASSKSRRSSVCSSRSETESQTYYSARNSDEDEDEFHDCVPVEDSLVTKIGKEELFQRVDPLMKGNDEERLEAFNLLDEYKYEMAEDAEFLWRFAKAHQMRAMVYGAQKNLEKKKIHVLEGLDYAKKALMLVDKNADVHKWFAILTGMQADFVSLKQKIQNGYIFQKHILIAIEIKPNDYSLHHLLGRFKFEVAKTSWLEKKMASSLIAELPDVTYEDAIPDLLKAEELNKTPWKENRLLLAKCYIQDGNYTVGVKWLNSAKEITPKTEEDTESDREINLLLQKCERYIK